MIENLELWKKAGKITSEAREYGKTLLKEGTNLLEIANKIESLIEKKGGKIAFPVQLSKNNIAAHYTPLPNDETILEEGDVIKLDLGVHIEGCIGDSALTIEIKTKKYTELINASKEALTQAIKICKPGIKIWEIGEAISSITDPTGFKVIRNLYGHKVDRYILHSGISIPNYNNKDKTELEEGTVIAIEPHVSNGAGLVKEGKPSSNYRLYQPRKVRDPISREVLNYIEKEFVSLPFAARHLIKKFPLAKVNFALNNLLKQNILFSYAQLPEVQKDCVVSQHEHTILIKDKPIVLTE
ncbi:type II methionyl aminopeptidase [Candidatus Woesearchaeota archaeon]|nr:type II methionyl aminopeptidase [Candidatus Woesearchaeota archaeon]